MKWIVDQTVSGSVLFTSFFVLYGLEFIIPLVRKRSKHTVANISFGLVLGLINLLFTSLTFLLADWSQNARIGLFHQINIPTPVTLFVSIIVLDFWAGYLIHYLFHKYEVLWKFHKVHHTDDLVDVTTTFRQHPMEGVIRILFHLSGMVILGISVWILLVYLTLSSINAQLEHANINLPKKLDRILQFIIVTPNMHKVHHSKHQPDTDSNYSNIFSLWDRLFKTFRARKNYTSIEYGLDTVDRKHSSFGDLLKLPFRNHR
jgi:sterol desaturase/sphingolipid hydroxylase (fatty acid hydroxylase superfamily)